MRRVTVSSVMHMNESFPIDQARQPPNLEWIFTLEREGLREFRRLSGY
jgi:hypothetical protein